MVLPREATLAQAAAGGDTTPTPQLGQAREGESFSSIGGIALFYSYAQLVSLGSPDRNRKCANNAGLFGNDACRVF